MSFTQLYTPRKSGRNDSAATPPDDGDKIPCRLISSPQVRPAPKDFRWSVDKSNSNQRGLDILHASTRPTPEQLSLSIANFTRAIHLLPEEPTFYHHRAEALLLTLDLETAISNFRHHAHLVSQLRSTTAWERSLLVRPITADSAKEGDGSVWIMRYRLAPVVYTWGQCLLDQKRFAEALKMFEYAGTLGFKTESVLLRCALAHIGLAAYDTALEILYKLTDVPSPPSPSIELYILRAKIYRHLGNVDFTNLDVQRALKIDASHPELPDLLQFTLRIAIDHKNNASEQILRGRPIAAIQCLTHAIDLDPDDWTLMFKRGTLLAETGQHDGAIMDLERVLAYQTSNGMSSEEVRRQLAEVQVRLGTELGRCKDVEGAIERFTVALGYAPSDPRIWKKRGDCFLAIRDVIKSIADLSRAVELDPGDVQCRERCGLLWATVADKVVAEGEWLQAIEIWTTAIRYNPIVAEYFFRRARCYYMSEQINEARQDLHQARQLDPSNIEIQAMFSQLTSGPPLHPLQPFPLPRPLRFHLPTALVPAHEAGLVGKTITASVPHHVTCAAPNMLPRPRRESTVAEIQGVECGRGIVAEAREGVLDLPFLALPRLGVLEGGPGRGFREEVGKDVLGVRYAPERQDGDIKSGNRTVGGKKKVITAKQQPVLHQKRMQLVLP
ncbi:Tetratricopeptide repeat protein 16 [Thoreauomyces humboldtii]|nr:Tetratricopeptide repeat protein 16 [Thoreauomyces humboldtii]